MIMLSVNKDSFTSSFPIKMSSVSFSCLIVLVRTFSTMLNRSCENEYPSLVSHLRGESIQSFSIMMLVIVCDRYPLSGWEHFLVFLVCWKFLSGMYIVKCFFSIYWDDHVPPHFLIWWITWAVFWGFWPHHAACGILLDQGSNPCPLHWQADS